MTRLMEVFMGTTVKTVFALCVLLFLMSPVLQASEDCNSLAPVWKLDGTDCTIYPYYYRVGLSSSASSHCQCNEDYHNYSLNGSATEYWRGLGCQDCDCVYTCKEPVYSCDGTSAGCFVPEGEDGCGDTHPRFGCYLCYGCDYAGCSESGSWNDKSFHRTYSSATDIGHDGYSGTHNFQSNLDITAIFNVGQVPNDPNCWVKPEVRYSEYSNTVTVRAKDGGDCCSGGGMQIIRIWCVGGSHVKEVKAEQTAGNADLAEIVKVNVTECTLTSHNSSIEVRLIPRNGEIRYQAGKTQTITVSCQFYDSAGNGCGSGSAAVTFILDCPPHTKGSI